MSNVKKCPLGWIQKKLTDVADLQTGIAKNSKRVEGNIELPYLRVANVQDGALALGDIQRISIPWNKIERYRLHKNDLLLVEGNGNPENLGRCAIWDGSIPDCVHQNHLFVVRARGSKIDYRYLALQIMSERGRHYLLSCSKSSSGLATLNSTQLKGFPILVPSLPEQTAIADLLSTWDEAIEKTERLVQAKEATLKGQIQRIMGKEVIDANGWSLVHLGELFSEVTRKVGEKELMPYSISAGIGFVSQLEKWGKEISGSQHKKDTHLKAGEFSYNKGNSKRYQQGCIYLLKDGEICVPNVFISFKLKAKDFVPEFFEHYFIANYHARELKRYITSGARSDGLLNLNKKDFFKITVPCPPPDEQKAIAEALTASQHEINLLKQLAEKYKTQKRGLMQKMLTGEWRVAPDVVKTCGEV